MFFITTGFLFNKGNFIWLFFSSFNDCLNTKFEIFFNRTRFYWLNHKLLLLFKLASRFFFQIILFVLKCFCFNFPRLFDPRLKFFKKTGFFSCERILNLKTKNHNNFQFIEYDCQLVSNFTASFIQRSEKFNTLELNLKWFAVVSVLLIWVNTSCMVALCCAIEWQFTFRSLFSTGILYVAANCCRCRILYVCGTRVCMLLLKRRKTRTVNVFTMLRRIFCVALNCMWIL